MNDKDIVLRLCKEIEELQLLTEGLSELECVPTSILTLAKQKANQIVDTLDLLPTQSVATPILGKKQSCELEDHREEKSICQKEEESCKPEKQISMQESLPQKISLGDNLSTQPVKDIRLGMSLGDRFRFRQVLFDNNGELMNDTINQLNTLSSYQEAEDLLLSRFKWEKENSDAKDFLKIVERRYHNS